MPSASSAADRAVSTSPAASAICNLRRQALEPYEGLLGVLQRARDSRDRRPDLPLGEPQQGETRLGVASQLVRRRVRLLRAREVAATPSDLADLVVPAGGDDAVEVVQLLAGCDCLRLGGGPVAAQPERLRPVDAAGAREIRSRRACRTSGSPPPSTPPPGGSRRRPGTS